MILRLNRAGLPSRRPRTAAVLALAGALLAGTAGLAVSTPSAQGFPTPSIAPVAWEIDLKYRNPRRIVMEVPGQGPRAYWYFVHTVTNNADQEIFFLPEVEMLTRDGRVLKSNWNIPRAVYDAIQQRARSVQLTSPHDMTARLLVGEDEQRSSVAVWEEPSAEMGTFNIFFGGLSGEVVTLKDAQGNELKNEQGQPIRVRKTRQLTYKVRGDAVAAERDFPAELVEDKWVMR